MPPRPMPADPIKAGTALPGVPVASPPDPTIIGRVARPFGRNGEVKVIVESAQPERIGKMKEIIVRLDERFRKLTVKRVIPSGEWFRVKFDGVDDPETADLLHGAEIVTSVAERPRLDNGEYYIDDLIGCRVVSSEDEELGFLTEVIQQGHHDLWVVEGARGEIMIPAVKQFINKVDTGSHLIIVNYMPGLWD